jgi:hypothetical protein
MQLSILELTFAVEDCEVVEQWLAGADLSGVLISMARYDDEIFAVFASERAMYSDQQKLMSYPAISSCLMKQSFVYRLTTALAPEQVFRSFPLGEGDEWYWGIGTTCYLAMQASALNQGQIAWLASCSEITRWEYIFDLSQAAIRY